MKTIIDGRRYDTELATLVASWTNHHNRGDFRRVEEDLYVTPSGAWFIHGAGGPMTEYAVPCGDGTTGSERIIPLSEGGAYDWLEEHGFTDQLEEHFADRIQDA